MGLRAMCGHAAAREAAEAISDLEGSAKALGRKSILAADIDRQAIALGDRDYFRITTESLCGGRGQRRSTFDVAPAVRRFAGKYANINVDNKLSGCA
jgi:hypothetical protein